jgi:hypothetical protein
LLCADDPLRSDTTLLATALLTLGVPSVGNQLFTCTYEHARGETLFHSIWTFAGLSKCKRFDSRSMQLAWNDGAWLLANPQHPLSILREGLTYQRAFSLTPRFTLEELARIETADTWIEAGCRNLILILRSLPRAAQKGVVRFGDTHLAFVPKAMPEAKKTTFLKYVESPSKRPEILAQ